MGSKKQEIAASNCKSPSVALGLVQAAGLACQEQAAEAQTSYGKCLLGACENETNFGTVFGSTSGTWGKPWLLAFLTSSSRNGTKNEPKLEPKADTNLDSRILTNQQRKPAKKITTSELLRQSLVHNCITQRRGT